jgi:hypothetical protein
MNSAHEEHHSIGTNRQQIRFPKNLPFREKRPIFSIILLDNDYEKPVRNRKEIPKNHPRNHTQRQDITLW